MTTAKVTSRAWPKRLGWGLMAFFAVGIALSAALPYLFCDRNCLNTSIVFGGRPDWEVVWIYTHAFSAMLALILGPFQFVKSLRNRFLTLHRWMGRIYLGIGVLFGGISGLVIAQHTTAGLTGRFGFSLLALLWLFTGLQAYRAIRRKDEDEHRAWMIRNYALTFAAVTLRLYIGVGMAALGPWLAGALHGGDFDALYHDIYSTVPWLCWVPNWLVAQWIVSRERQQAQARHAAFAAPAAISTGRSAG